MSNIKKHCFMECTAKSRNGDFRITMRIEDANFVLHYNTVLFHFAIQCTATITKLQDVVVMQYNWHWMGTSQPYSKRRYTCVTHTSMTICGKMWSGHCQVWPANIPVRLMAMPSMMGCIWKWSGIHSWSRRAENFFQLEQAEQNISCQGKKYYTRDCFVSEQNADFALKSPTWSWDQGVWKVLLLRTYST